MGCREMERFKLTVNELGFLPPSHGSVKEKLERAKDKGEEVVDKAKDRLQRR